MFLQDPSSKAMQSATFPAVEVFHRYALDLLCDHRLLGTSDGFSYPA